MLQGVVAEASFCREPRSGGNFFFFEDCVSAHHSQLRQTIALLLTIGAIMLEEHVDLVACEINGLVGANQMVTAVNLPVSLRKFLPTQIFQWHLAPHRCEVPNEWSDVWFCLALGLF